jgi:hypothetical protein
MCSKLVSDNIAMFVVLWVLTHMYSWRHVSSRASSKVMKWQLWGGTSAMILTSRLAPSCLVHPRDSYLRRRLDWMEIESSSQVWSNTGDRYVFKYQLQHEQNNVKANSQRADSLGSTLLISACTASVYLQLYVISFQININIILHIISVADWKLMNWCFIPGARRRLFSNPQFPYKLYGLIDWLIYCDWVWDFTVPMHLGPK